MTEKRIFLSYAPGDGSFVRAVAGALRTEGFEPWLDETLGPGERYSEAVQTALRGSSVVIAFLGGLTNPPWLNFEIGAALGEDKPVLPVFLNDSARKSGPPQLRDLAGIDASDLKPAEVAESITQRLATPA
jgi:TIR domain-containing protein